MFTNIIVLHVRYCSPLCDWNCVFHWREIPFSLFRRETCPSLRISNPPWSKPRRSRYWDLKLRSKAEPPATSTTPPPHSVLLYRAWCVLFTTCVHLHPLRNFLCSLIISWSDYLLIITCTVCLITHFRKIKIRVLELLCIRVLLAQLTYYAVFIIKLCTIYPRKLRMR